MSKLALAAVCAAILTAALLAVAARASPVTAAPPASLEQRGEYLALLAGCGRCHTPGALSGQADDSRALAGGTPLPDQAGTVLSSNLTPDPETGLGTWSEQQIQRAIRAGFSPGKGRLSPVMPYLTYQGMADMDVHAIVAYLRQLPAVSNPIPGGGTPSDRWQGLTRIPYQQTAPSRMPSPPRERGRYLVRAIAGCAECHSPRTADGFPDPARYLLGAEQEVAPGVTSTAPDITQDRERGIGAWSDEEIGRAIAGTRLDGTALDSVMHGQYLAGMEPDDLAAVVAYLRTVQPGTNPVQEDRRPPRRRMLDPGHPAGAEAGPAAVAPAPTLADTVPAPPASLPVSLLVPTALLLAGIAAGAAVAAVVALTLRRRPRA